MKKVSLGLQMSIFLFITYCYNDDANIIKSSNDFFITGDKIKILPVGYFGKRHVLHISCETKHQLQSLYLGTMLFAKLRNYRYEHIYNSLAKLN